MIAALLFLAVAAWSPTRTPLAESAAASEETPAADAERCPYRLDRKRKMWLHASQIPRYVYYRELEPGDGTRRASVTAHLVYGAERIHEATFEVVTRIEEGTTTYRVVMTRTLDGEKSGFDLAEPARIVLNAARGEDEEPLAVPSLAAERTERGGWTYESATFAPDLEGMVALIDAPRLDVTGPGDAWKPVLDDTDRDALRYFLWEHAPGGRDALRLSEERRKGRPRGRTGMGGDGTDGGDERDG